jgi:hypothetical protein
MKLPRKAQGREGKTLIGEMAVWYWLKTELLMTWQYRIGLTTCQKKEFMTGETKAGDSGAKEKQKQKEKKERKNPPEPKILAVQRRWSRILTVALNLPCWVTDEKCI